MGARKRVTPDRGRTSIAIGSTYGNVNNKKTNKISHLAYVRELNHGQCSSHKESVVHLFRKLSQPVDHFFLNPAGYFIKHISASAFRINHRFKRLYQYKRSQFASVISNFQTYDVPFHALARTKWLHIVKLVCNTSITYTYFTSDDRYRCSDK